MASWLLNSLRIAVLVQLGISGHPELAIGGFHSHAGWLMFTLLSLGIVLVTQSLGLFRNKSMEATTRAPVLPFFSDPVVAQILPFAVFMASGLLAQSFSVLPATLYPMRAIAMAVTLVLFWQVYRAMPWRLDPVAATVGLVVGVIWLVTAPAAEDDDAALSTALAAYSGLGLFFWIVCRVVGTTLLVPLVEELFFRGYLMQRIAGKDNVIWRTILALIISSVFFGLLHDRWLAGGLAGLAFGLLVLRSNRLPDAVIAHAVANAVIAAAAVWYGDWSLI